MSDFASLPGCPDCGSRLKVEETGHALGKTFRKLKCDCGGRFESEETIVRRLPPVATRRHRTVPVGTGGQGQAPTGTGAHPPPPTATEPPRGNAGGVGGGVSEGSGSDPDSGPISPDHPERGRAREAAAMPLTGYSLCQLFARIRSEALGGIPWQSVRVVGGTATDMAEAINADPAARADVEPTIRLLFKLAKDGKAGDKSAEIVRSGSFAFGAWCSKWTELREALHRKTPTAERDLTAATDAKASEYREMQKAMYG